MRHADSRSNTRQSESPESGSRAVPTFIATDLLEKLIADRDAAAVDRRIVQRRRH